MDVQKILADALSKPVAPERPMGACRVYVSILDADMAKLVSKAAKKLGKDFQKKSYYGDRNALYIGYDNFDGKDLARGSAVVAALKAAGIDCVRCEGAD